MHRKDMNQNRPPHCNINEEQIDLSSFPPHVHHCYGTQAPMAKSLVISVASPQPLAF